MKKGLLSFFIILALWGFMLLFEHFGPNQDSSKLGDIETLWKAIPPYSRLVETTTTTMASGRKAYFSKQYKSDADYDDIKNYYHELLVRNGWNLIEEKSVKDWWIDKGGMRITYRQLEYSLNIQYAGKKANYGWDYAISIGWGSGSR